MWFCLVDVTFSDRNHLLSRTQPLISKQEASLVARCSTHMVHLHRLLFLPPGWDKLGGVLLEAYAMLVKMRSDGILHFWWHF